MKSETRQRREQESITIACLEEEREIIIRAAQLMGYTREGSTHGFSTYARDIIMTHARQVIQDASEAKSNEAPKRRRN